MLINLRYTFDKTVRFLLVLFIFCVVFIKYIDNNKKLIVDIQNKNEMHVKPIDTNTILELVNKYNSEEKLLNEDIYAPLEKKSIIIVIIVDKFSIGFKHLLISLSQIKGIEEALVIFSHSYFDENVNGLIRSIDFCRVMQIFYPYSVQTHPHEFPGYHPHDCPRDMKWNFAEALNCTGAFFPDIHGRYRDPLQAQKKHHWWWTANKIFENSTGTTNHELVVFLEVDYFFMEDFIYMALYMKHKADSLPQCEFISLGTAEESVDLDFNENSTYSVEITTWDPRHHSNVLAFDLSVWKSIVSHYDLFCSIDDSSWSHSLYYISLNRKDGKRYRSIASAMPRVFKTNSCGYHERSLDCDVLTNVCLIMDLQKRHYSNLFPSYLELYINIELEIDEFVIFDYVQSNGGWSDPRDIEMCRNITANKVQNILLDMTNEFHNYIDDE